MTIPFDTRKLGGTIQMEGMVVSEAGRLYVLLLPGADDVSFMTLSVHGVTLEEWDSLMRQLDIVETEVLANARESKTAKVILRKSQRQISQGVSWSVYHRDEYTCCYCGATGIPMTVDHLVTWEAGGPSTADNLLTSCRRCNKKRGDTPFREWIQSNYYKERVPRERIQLHLDLEKTLDGIPRLVHKRSSR
jgi:hypothetical protein